MPLSMSQASQPVFIQGLKGLITVLDKTAAHCEAKKIDPAAILQFRLFPDMLTFTRQVQLASEFARGCAGRLGGVEVSPPENTETSFAELKARVEAAIAFIAAVPADKIDGAEDRDITLIRYGEASVVKGQPYLLGQAMPNFYFHLTTAYAIARHNGVEVGKVDFLGAN